MPQEIVAFILVVVLNPVTLVFLYKRTRFSNRRTTDLRIYLQIGIIMVIFVLYMIVYYLYNNLHAFQLKSVALLNSILYTLDNMVNPSIYFLFNPRLRKDCRKLISFQ